MPKRPKKKKRRPDSGHDAHSDRDEHGRFLPGVSGNRLGAASKLANMGGSIAEIVVKKAKKERIATALLGRATAGDPRALELVLQMLQRADGENMPKDAPNYDLLTDAQLDVLRFLVQRANRENAPDSQLLGLLHVAAAELEPADAEEPGDSGEAEC